MKYIHKFKSLNFNKRKSKEIKFIIIHYTALNSISESIKYLCEKNNKVSSHYIISKKGEIYNLVSEKKRAWHAGASYWNGLKDINSSSIGIELDYLPDEINTEYNQSLIFSLIKLLKLLVKKYNIELDKILGHSDIAPYRKIDPGEKFPWKFLEKKKVAFEVKKFEHNITYKNLLEKWFFKVKFRSKKKKILFMLDYIGYDISLASKNSLKFKQLLLIYGNRHRLYKGYKLNQKNTVNIIKLHFLNIILTKLKK